MHFPYNSRGGSGRAVVDYEELFRIKTVHAKNRRWPRWACHAGRVLAGLSLGAACAWSFSASLVLASASSSTLDAGRHDVSLALDPNHAAALRQIAEGQPGSLAGDPAIYRSASLVLDDVALTDAGARGGYFYKIYLDPSAAAQRLVGSLGPFEIAAARQRGTASLQYALVDALKAWGAQPMSALAVSFRQTGSAGAHGPLIRIGSVRLELSTEASN